MNFQALAWWNIWPLALFWMAAPEKTFRGPKSFCPTNSTPCKAGGTLYRMLNMPTWEITKIHHMNPLRTNPLRTWGYLAHNSHLFHIALKNPRVGWKFINRFLSNGSAVPQNAPCSFPGERRPVGANERNVGSWLVWGPPSSKQYLDSL